MYKSVHTCPQIFYLNAIKHKHNILNFLNSSHWNSEQVSLVEKLWAYIKLDY
jgi:hypothetical protein